jgi:secondary thiamine-phosphate synthase enzyme
MAETLWFQEPIVVETTGKGFTNITARVAGVVERSRVALGLCVVFVRHTSASLVIQENADPAVLADLERWFSELAPEQRSWKHDDEGPDDMPAHARSVLTKTSESIPISGRRLVLAGHLPVGAPQGAPSSRVDRERVRTRVARSCR